MNKLMREENLTRIVKAIIFIIIVGTPLFYLRNTVFPYIISKNLFFQAAVEALFFFWLLLAAANKKYRPRANPLILALLIFISVLVLTAALGVDPSRSFWSTYERVFGVVAILHFAVFALILASLWGELPWRKIFYGTLLTAFAVDVIAILELGIPNLLLEEGIAGRPGGTFDNPTFFAGYLIFNIFIALYLVLAMNREADPEVGFKSSWLAENNPKRNTTSAALFIFIATSLITLFLTQSRGDILGFGGGIFVLFILFAFRPPQAMSAGFLKRRTFYVATIIAVAILTTVFWSTRTNNFWKGVPGLNRFRDISISLESSELQPRLIALKAAWHGFLERPIFGWGWDNFNVVFNKFYDPRALEVNYQETRFDKPHNFVMEDMVAGGVLLLLSHLALLALLIAYSFKVKDRLFGQIMAGTITAYVVQNLFIFDTIGPDLMLYLLIGFTAGFFATENNWGVVTEAMGTPSKSLNKFLVILAGAAVLVLIYKINIQSIEAAHYEYLGYKDFIHQKPSLAISDFNTALNLGGPYRWNFQRDDANTIAEAYFYNPGIIPDGAAWAMLKGMEQVRDEHPQDAYNHYVLLDMYNKFSKLDPQALLPAAEREAQAALALSPKRQEVYIYLSKTKTLEGDTDAALKILKDAVDLDPNVADSHFYYGLVAFAAKKPEVGYAEINRAISLGRKWQNFFEPRTVAGYFADTGRYDEALDLYKAALAMGPGDLETEIKLGVIYFFVGDNDSARKYLLDAKQRFDFKSSSSYGQLKPILDKLGID